MDNSVLREYAELIARKGICIMPGQEVIIRTAPEQLAFLEMLVEECYLAGSGKVCVEWRLDALTRLDVRYQTTETLGTVENWEKERLQHKLDVLPANIYLDSDDPDGLAGVDQAKLASARQKRFEVTRKYSDAMENKYQWCVAAVPGQKWAEKVFPGIPSDEAVEKLWLAILKCARAESGAIENWEKHNTELRRKCDWLNSLKLRRLKYKSLISGTDFEVGLMPQMRFMGGADALETPKGLKNHVFFNANIPSEEIFTTPMKGDANGILYATRPLSYRGVLIENFSVEFKDGKVSAVHAEKNEETLRLMVQMDEGASMLGECALVPYHSPIRDSGILFYNTLLDENASCHMALGDGYSSCLENAADYSPEEARKLGVNFSMIHEDFMIGTEDLSITGISEDGKEHRIFTNGNWVEE